MKIEDLLEELDEMLARAWSLPLSGGKVLIEEKMLRECLDEIRDSIPNELKQAKAIVADRSDIVNDARKEAQIIIRTAEERVQAMIEQDELVKQAKSRSSDILTKSENQAKEVRRATNEYVDDIMKQIDDKLTIILSEIRKARKNLRSSYK